MEVSTDLIMEDVIEQMKNKKLHLQLKNKKLTYYPLCFLNLQYVHFNSIKHSSHWIFTYFHNPFHIITPRCHGHLFKHDKKKVKPTHNSGLDGIRQEIIRPFSFCPLSLGKTHVREALIILILFNPPQEPCEFGTMGSTTFFKCRGWDLGKPNTLLNVLQRRQDLNARSFY